MPNTQKLKNYLEELINSSPALQSLTPDERRLRTTIMLSADEEAMGKFIDILEDEQEEADKIEENFQKQADSLRGLMDEVEGLEKTVKREIVKEKEKVSKKESDKKAKELLEKLNKVTDEE